MSDFNGVYEAREAVNAAARNLVKALAELDRCVDDEYKTPYRQGLNRLRFKAKEFVFEIEDGIA